MKFFALNKNLIPLFSDMDPFAILSLRLPPQTTAIGAFVTDESTGKDLPAALTVVTETEYALIIKWLYVAGQYRGQGLGDEFLYEIARLASGLGKSRLKAHFFKAFGRKNICYGEELYFAGHGFVREGIENTGGCFFAVDTDCILQEQVTGRLTFEELTEQTIEADFLDTLREGRDFTLPLPALKDSPLLRESAGLRQVVSLAEEDLATIAGQLQTCRNAKCTGLLKELDENLDLTNLDLDLSCVICPQKKLECILLVARVRENAIMPVLFRSLAMEDNIKLILLLQYAVNKAVIKYPPGTQIMLRIADIKYQDAIQKILGIELQ